MCPKDLLALTCNTLLFVFVFVCAAGEDDMDGDDLQVSTPAAALPQDAMARGEKAFRGVVGMTWCWF